MTTTNEELRRLADAATPAEEWSFAEKFGEIGFRVRSGYQAFFRLGRPHDELNAEVSANAAFIKAANPAKVKAMLDQIDALEKEVKSLNKALDDAYP